MEIKSYNRDPMVNFLIGDRYRIIRHLLLLICVGGLWVGNINVTYDESNAMWQILIASMIFFPIILNVYIFVPKLLFRNHPYLFATALLLSLLIALGTMTLIQYYNWDTYTKIYGEAGNVFRYALMNNLSSGVSFSLIIAGTTSIMIMQAWLRESERIEQLEQASAITELEMLKSQINPHFLFNMLNNAIVLTKEEPRQAREVILKLKEMLNYQLEKSLADKISLREDINFLNDLLMLEKVRRDRFRYNIVCHGETGTITVPPLLFIPFVENAMKHGNDNTRESYILLVFKASDGWLDFFCTNSIPATTAVMDTGGLGLSNIKRRLELIYGKDYTLDVTKTSKTYNVNLRIKI